MKGLLLKDFYNIARSGRLYLAMLLIYGVLSYANGGALMLTMVAVLFAMMLPMSAIGYDEKDRWEPLCLSLPVAPAVMVLEKYVLAILCCILGIALGGGVGWILGQLGGTGDMAGYPATVAAAMAVSLAYNAVTLPVNLRLGVERGRIVCILVLMIPFLGILMLERQGILESARIAQAAAWLTSGAGILAAAAALALLLVVSFLASLRLYRRKEW